MKMLLSFLLASATTLTASHVSNKWFSKVQRASQNAATAARPRPASFDVAQGTQLALSVALAPPLSPVVSEGEVSYRNTELTWSNGLKSVELKIRGDVEFTDDDRDVKSLSAYGYFCFKESHWWFNTRRYEVTSDAAGHLTRTYTVDGQTRPLDDAGRTWLARVMPDIIRETGAGASARVQRILRERGPAGVLAEISLIRSDSSKRTYLQELIRNGNLNLEQLRSAMRKARAIASDGEKSELVLAVAPAYLKDDLRDVLFQAVNTIASDGDRRRVLSGLVEKDSGSRETLTLAAKSAGEIASDGEKAGILMEIVRHYKGNEEIRGAYFHAVNSIASDGERHQVLSALLAHDGGDRDSLVQALRSGAAISSDGEKAGVLAEACNYYFEDDAVRRAFFDATHTISSDGERRNVLSALLHRPGLKAATLSEIAKSAREISSDGEKAEVLVEMAALDVQDASVRPDFFDAVNSISADRERRRVLSVVARQPGLAPNTLVELVKSAKGISSDGEKAEILAEAAQLKLDDEKVQAAFFDAISSISSDGERGRVLSSLLKRKDLSAGTVIDAVQSAMRISSDEVKADVLGQIVESHSGDPAVRSALRKALESIESDSEYRRVMSALSKHENL